MNITPVKYVSLISIAMFTLAVCNGGNTNSAESKPALNDGKTMDLPVITRPITLDGNIAPGDNKCRRQTAFIRYARPRDCQCVPYFPAPRDCFRSCRFGCPDTWRTIEFKCDLECK